MKTTRVFQLTALVLVVISVVQVGWWAVGLRGFIIDRTHDALELYGQQVTAAQALLDAGRSPEDVRKLLPRVTIEGNTAAASKAVVDYYESEEHSRVNQYVWESAFFLLALFACIAVIARALRDEARVLQEQDHFLAMVSHQFKTPLASLQLSLETVA
jgi:signal transduction histidine kinase